MSCKVTVKTQVKCFNTFKQVAEEQGWKNHGTTFTKGNKSFEMRKDGEVYSIRHEDYHHVDTGKLIQGYGTEMVIQQARKRGLTARKTGVDKNGNVKVEILC